LVEKLHVNIEDGDLLRAPNCKSPNSTRRANLQRFIFGGGANKSRTGAAAAAASAGGEEEEEEEEERKREEQEAEDGGRAIEVELERKERAAAEEVAKAAAAAAAEAAAEEEETLAMKQAKLSVLKVLQEQKKELQQEVGGLGKEVESLQAEYDREERAGSRKQLLLREELERRTKEAARLKGR